MSAEHAIDSPVAGSDVRVLGLVGTGHFFSHFLGIALPPLFPVMQADLSVSYTALGALLAVANVATTVCQAPVGVMVDRFGARWPLALGLGIMSGATAAIGLVPGYGAVLALMLLVGMGNSVIHPADYAVLAARVSPQRLGRAFSLHTFAGHVGWTISPLTLAFLTALWNWRLALVAAGVCGVIAAVWILLHGRILDEPSESIRLVEPARSRPAATPPARLIASAPILLFFLYMIFSAVASGGVTKFSVTVLVEERGMALATANFALTALLTASAIGVLLGGWIADRTRRHDMMIVAGYCVAAGILVIAGLLPVPIAALVVGLGTVGLAQGMIRPSRDMMVRASAPAGSVGTVFGFVTAGQNVGSALAPILFGWLIDQGFGGGIFVIAAAAMLFAIGAALLANNRAIARAIVEERG